MLRTKSNLRALWAGLAIFVLVGCENPRLKTRYAPFHPRDNQNITFRVIANDDKGIDRIELYLYEYELYVDHTNNNMQSARQRPNGRWGLVATHNLTAKPKSIEDTFKVIGFPDSSFITFIIRVVDTDGYDASESSNFAAGAWPFGNSPIPIWGNGAPANRIDVCFVADKGDFTDARDMLDGLPSLIFDGYHESNGVQMGKRLWNFYYSPELGSITDYDTPPRVMEIPASVSGSAVIDHAAIIHTTIKRDWASGGNFGTEPINIGTAVHESAHAALGLKDEYAGGGHGDDGNPHANNYSTLAKAQEYNTSHGWPAGDAILIEGSWFRPEPATLRCIMLDDGDATLPNFARTCLARAFWFYGELE